MYLIPFQLLIGKGLLTAFVLSLHPFKNNDHLLTINIAKDLQTMASSYINIKSKKTKVQRLYQKQSLGLPCYIEREKEKKCILE